MDGLAAAGQMGTYFPLGSKPLRSSPSTSAEVSHMVEATMLMTGNHPAYSVHSSDHK